MLLRDLSEIRLNHLPTAVRVANAVPLQGNPAGLQGQMGFAINVYEHLTTRAYDVLFPELHWSKTIPQSSVDTAIPAGADFASYTAKDRRGKGAFRAVQGKDIPVVGLSIGKVEVPIEEGAVMAQVDLHDIEKVMMGHNLNIISEHGETMRLAAERHIEDVFFFGYAELDFAGYLDYPYTPATTASTKTAGGTTWAVATAMEIIGDINTALGAVYINSRGAHSADRIELPVEQYLLIANKPMTSNIGGADVVLAGETVLEFIKRKNSTTALTGKQLDVRPLFYLDGAGVSNADRMIVSDMSPENHYMPMPLPFTVLPEQNVQYAINVFARWRFGSYHKPYPLASYYMDGI